MNSGEAQIEKLIGQALAPYSERPDAEASSASPPP